MIRPSIIAAIALGFAGSVALPAAASAAIAGTTIFPLAGTGGFCANSTLACGDGGPATAAQLGDPRGAGVTPSGAVIFADTGTNRIRRIEADGTISTVAGSGSTCTVPTGSCGDGSPATTAQLTAPRGVAVIDEDSFFIADFGNNKVRRVDGKAITTVAGTGSPGVTGDGGAATSAQLDGPADVATRDGASVLIADRNNARVRRVSAGVISTVAGTGQFCTDPATSCGDGGASTAADLGGPNGIAMLPGAGFLFTEPTLSRVRRVSADGGGTIDRVAGRQDAGAATFSGDGGAATAAGIHAPDDVVALTGGGFVVADTSNNRIRLVDASGTITTVAGDGSGCSPATAACGDGGDAAAASMTEPRGVAIDGSGDVVVGASTDSRLRRVDLPSAVSPPTTQPPGDTSTTPTAPQVNETVLVQTLRGRVFIRVPGAKRAVPLDQVKLIPDGSVLDTRTGQARLTVARPDGTTDFADLSEGILTIDQRKNGSLVDLRLTEQLSGCPVPVKDPGAAGAQDGVKTVPRRTRRARTATLLAGRLLAFAPRADTAARKKRTRRSRVKAKGKFRTDGKYGSAVVRGTQWLTVDDCRRGRRARTRVSVIEGKVGVRDFARARTTLVPAGASYVAYARRS